MSDLDLNAIEARATTASPAPWKYGTVESVAGGTLYDATRRIADLCFEQYDDHDGSIVRHLLSDEADANGEFIANARKDVPALIAEVRRLRAVVRDLQLRLAEDDDDWGDT